MSAVLKEATAAPEEAPAEGIATFEFDAEFQTKIAALAFRSGTFMRQVSHLIKPEYFENAAEAALVNVALKHYEKYREAISDLKLCKGVLAEAIRTKLIRSEEKTEVVAKVRELFETDIAAAGFVVDSVAGFARQQAVGNAILASVDMLKRGDYEKIQRLMKQALDTGVRSETAEYDFFEMAEKRAEARLELVSGAVGPRGITTGQPLIDDCLYHKGWGRKELSVLLGGAKAGKCVTRDTMLFTEDGLAEIGDYIPSTLAVDSFAPHVMSILGMNGVEKTSHVYNSGRNPTVRIATGKGFELEGTRHHPMLVMNAAGEHEWRRLDEIKVGDFMVVQRGARVFGSHTDLNYACDAAAKRIGSSSRADAMTPITLPREMTPELAEFLAMVVAEGYCGERGALSFTQKDEVILARFGELARLLFGVEVRVIRAEGKIACACIQSVVLEAYLRELGLIWEKSAAKLVPTSIRRAPESCVRAFLSALIGLEGNVQQHSANKAVFDLTMASPKLIKQVQMLLLNFGIVARRTVKPSMATNGLRILRDYHRLQISGSRNITALRDLGVYESRKNEALAVVGRDSTARDWIPNARNLIGHVMNEVRASSVSVAELVGESTDRALRCIRSGRSGEVRELTYALAEKLVTALDRADISGDACAKLRALVRQGYCYDPVTSIQEGEAETVDLTVPGTHSFFANGLVSHNTTALINFGLAAAEVGYNVAYFTLEVGHEIISDRSDASISGTPMKSILTNIHAIKDAILAKHGKVGKFIIKEYPSGTMRPADIEAWLERKESIEGVKFDLVIVDYADLMAPDFRYSEPIENSKSIYTALRACAQKFDVALLTATQTNREGFKSTVAKAEHVAEDFNKVRIADIMISISITDEERAMGEARLYFAASRNTEGGFCLRLKQDISRMRFIERVLGRE